MSPTVRDLLRRYEENKETAENPAEAMLNACDELLAEMEEGNPHRVDTEADR